VTRRPAWSPVLRSIAASTLRRRVAEDLDRTGPFATDQGGLRRRPARGSDRAPRCRDYQALPPCTGGAARPSGTLIRRPSRPRMRLGARLALCTRRSASTAPPEPALGGRPDRNPRRQCSRGDEEVNRSLSTCLTTSAGRFGVDGSVRPGAGGVERERVEGRLGQLQALLASGAFGRIGGGVGAGGEFGEGDRGEREFRRERLRIDVVESDYDRRVSQPAGRASVRHAALRPGRRFGRGPRGNVRRSCRCRDATNRPGARIH
jgi:hypothetical protein